MFDYFYNNDNEQYLFLQLPVMLIKEDCFKDLSDSSKILYSLLLNRTSLSRKNDWTDEQGRVYIIYTIDEIMSDLRCYKQKATKLMKELKDIGLIETVRQGLNKPNLIYVKNFATILKYKKEGKEGKEGSNIESTRKFENQTSEGSQIKPQEVLKSNPIYNDYNNTYINSQSHKSKSKSDYKETKTDKDYDIIDYDNNNAYESNSLKAKKEDFPVVQADQSNKQKEKSSKASKDINIVDDFIKYEEIIKDNIDYNSFLQNRQDVKMVDNIISIMLDVILTKGETVKINNEEKSRELVKSVYMKLRYNHIEHVIEQYKQQYHQITYKHAYVKTMLYNSYNEIDFYYTNQVRADGMIR